MRIERRANPCDFPAMSPTRGRTPSRAGVDLGRRGLAAGLLGAAGGALLNKGCAPASDVGESRPYDPEPELGASAQALGEGCTPEVTPQAFGAVGDGRHDDTDALQQALDTRSVFVPAGNYKVTRKLWIRSGTLLRMDDNAELRRDFAPSPTPPPGGWSLFGFRDTVTTQVTLLGGRLNGCSDLTRYATGHNLFGGRTGSGLLLDGVTFMNVIDNHAIDLAGFSDVRIQNCRFLGKRSVASGSGNKEAIQLDPDILAGQGSTNSDFVIENCYFGASPTAGFGAWPVAVGNHSANRASVVVQRTRILGCHMEGCSIAAVAPYAWDDTLIWGNRFSNCARGVYLQQGTGEKRQGCVNTVIVDNKFLGGGANCVFAAANASEPESHRHRGLVVQGNLFQGVETCLRLGYMLDAVFSGNTCVDVRGGVVNLWQPNDAVTVTNNTIENVTGTCFFVASTNRNVTITSNTGEGFAARVVHVTGEGGDERENIAVCHNTFADCAGPVFIAVDSGATHHVSVNHNALMVGSRGWQPSTDEVIRVTVTGRAAVLHNQLDSRLARKLVRVPHGIFSGNVLGSPEGVVIAGVGSTAYRADLSDRLYVKQASSGTAAGWVSY
jgi:hypothetical protein